MTSCRSHSAIIMPTPPLPVLFPDQNSLKFPFCPLISLVLCPFHFVSCRQHTSIRLLVKALAASTDLPVSVFTFQVAILINWFLFILPGFVAFLCTIVFIVVVPVSLDLQLH